MRELYQQLIIDHGRSPRHFGCLENATHRKEGFNPLCGDKITVYFNVEDDRIVQASFEGSGCAISMASASLMMETLIGKTLEQAQQIFDAFHALVTRGEQSSDLDMDKLIVLAGVNEFPARVKCATLAWQAFHAACNHSKELVSTES